MADTYVWILLRIPVARILWNFDFLRGLAPAVWMDFRLEGTRRIANLLTFMLRSLKAERCDLVGGGGEGNSPGAGTRPKQGFPPCPSIVKSSQRRTQIDSKSLKNCF